MWKLPRENYSGTVLGETRIRPSVTRDNTDSKGNTDICKSSYICLVEPPIKVKVIWIMQNPTVQEYESISEQGDWRKLLVTVVGKSC